MSSEESIRTDASTVHRTDDPEQPISEPSVDAEEIAQAKTVIRGSSRSKRVDSRRDQLERTPAAVAQVLLGQRLNHFMLEELIGGGGMGAVFRAHDEQLDRTVAIKVIPFVGDDADLKRRFRNEAQSAAKLDHPRIARVFDVGSHGEWHYIVFEYIEGTNIRDLVTEDGVLPIDEAVFYTSQLADALQHAAERGIVHRDIKPSNVLIGPGEKIKLVDMGLARSDNIDLSDDMTASGVTLGTFDYISPEQAHDPRDADLRSDIYSLGCTLYFMLTGSPPYPGGTMLQKLLSHGSAPPPDARELRPEVSGNLVAVIQKMLAKNPGERYQTATDLIADLREVAIRDGLTRAQQLSPVAVAAPNPFVIWLERNAPWIVAAMLLIASAGWIHLESAALREDIIVPPTAGPPEASSVLADRNDVREPIEQNGFEPGQSGPTEPADRPDQMGQTGYPPAGQPPKNTDIPVPPALLATDSPEVNSLSARRADVTPPDDPSLSATGPSLPTLGPALASQQDGGTDSSAYPSGGVVRVVEAGREQYGRDTDGAATAPTLSRALQLAATLEANRIEIAVPVVYSEPVRIDVDGLLIKSTVGGSQIVFQPTDARSVQSPAMFAIGQHQIQFADLHFLWNVPSEQLAGGSLFQLSDNRLVGMTHCSVTVSNPAYQDEVYAFDVITDPARLPQQRRQQVDEFPLVCVDLNNVVIRGQMTMLHMDYAAKLWLFWNNGLLSVTQHMIDTAGARREPSFSAEPILLNLTRVTAHAAQGICRMRVQADAAHRVPINRFARNSVFVVDSGMPHFEFAGLSSLDRPTELLQLRGDLNAYSVEPTLADPMLRLATSDGQTEITRMNQLLASKPPWAGETSPRWSVSWLTEPSPDIPANQRKPENYLQEGASPPGFDETTLPTIPRPPDQPEDVSEVSSAAKNAENPAEL